MEEKKFPNVVYKNLCPQNFVVVKHYVVLENAVSNLVSFCLSLCNVKFPKISHGYHVHYGLPMCGEDSSLSSLY